MYTIGLDIGTTTISAAVLCLESGSVVKTATLPNNSFIASERAEEKIQDPERIIEVVLKLADELVTEFPETSSIGVTGQMHGIVYLNREGRSVSPLYTWQDGRANLPLASGKSSYEELLELTGYKVPSGYGLATHYCNLKQGAVPSDAVKLCTIHDYVVMRLTERKTPLTHISDAASLGIYDLKNNRFDEAAVAAAGISPSILPDVALSTEIAGNYRNIPVSVAIGDNQASFIGSVADIENGMLINVGTGSQVSAATAYRDDLKTCELRPLNADKYLTAGSALCGGRAYAVLLSFWRSYLAAAGLEVDRLYDLMDKLAASADPDCEGMTVDTAFSGTRQEPDRRGSVVGITTENFTPANLTRGVLNGMTEELYSFATEISPSGMPSLLVGSGNGLRKNPVLTKIASERFGKALEIPAHGEEAAFGAALFSTAAAGVCKSLTDAGKYIKYIKN